MSWTTLHENQFRNGRIHTIVNTKLYPHPLETNDTTKDGTSEASENAGEAAVGLISPFQHEWQRHPWTKNYRIVMYRFVPCLAQCSLRSTGVERSWPSAASRLSNFVNAPPLIFLPPMRAWRLFGITGSGYMEMLMVQQDDCHPPFPHL
jgi:hypothetical protein